MTIEVYYSEAEARKRFGGRAKHSFRNIHADLVCGAICAGLTIIWITRAMAALLTITSHP